MLLFSPSPEFKYVLVKKQGSEQSNSRLCTGYIELLFILKVLLLLYYIITTIFCSLLVWKKTSWVYLSFIIVIIPGVRQKLTTATQLIVLTNSTYMQCSVPYHSSWTLTTAFLDPHWLKYKERCETSLFRLVCRLTVKFYSQELRNAGLKPLRLRKRIKTRLLLAEWIFYSVCCSAKDVRL